MIESDVFVQALQDMGVNFFTGVPDSMLGGIIAELMTRKVYTPAVREDEAMAMAAGAYMAGRVPAVLMQNSGLGTSLNALLALAVLYRVPLLVVVGWRGHGPDAPEHVQTGRTLLDVLRAAELPFVAAEPETAEADVARAAAGAAARRSPVALLLREGMVKG